jgi:hypothetical protein
VQQLEQELDAEKQAIMFEHNKAGGLASVELRATLTLKPSRRSKCASCKS